MFCDSPSDPGFLYEIYNEINKLSKKFEYELVALPWQRARHLSQKGEIEGLALVVPGRYPEHTLSQYHLGKTKLCFYQNRDSNLKNEEDLKNKNFGYFAGYDYGVVGGHEGLKSLGLHLIHISAKNPNRKTLQLLEQKRLDLILSTPLVISYLNEKVSKKEQAKKVYCLPQIVNARLAISPKTKNAKDIINEFKQRYLQLEKANIVSNLLKKYKIHKEHQPNMNFKANR